MILIVDDSNKRRKKDLRDLLYSAKIPCAVVNSEQLKKCAPARITVTFAENETQLSIVSLRAGATDYIVINDTGRRMINCDAYFYDPDRDGGFTEFIKRRMLEKHGLDIENPSRYPVLFSKKGVFLFNRQVSLTDTEEMILRCLLFAKGEWQSAEDIAFFAYPEMKMRRDTGSVAVHICNINKKSVLRSGKKIILSKRFYGYKLNVLVKEKKKRGPYKKKVIPPQYV